MKSNFNPESYIKPKHPSSMKVKKGVFLQTFKKLYVYTSYVLFLKEDIFEHNKEVKVDRCRIQETGNQRGKLCRIPGEQVIGIIAEGQRFPRGRPPEERRDLIEY